MWIAFASEKFLELFDTETGIACNATHCESVYRIVARNRHDTNTVRHDDVFTLTQDAKASLFKSLHGIEVIDAGNLRHVTPPRSLREHPGLERGHRQSQGIR